MANDKKKHIKKNSRHIASAKTHRENEKVVEKETKK